MHRFLATLFTLTILSLPGSAQGDVITDLITPGGYVYSPFAIDSNLAIHQAERYGNTLYLVGSAGGTAAAQTVTFGEAGPAASDLRLFHSLAPQVSNGGIIRDVKEINGQIYYVGQSQSTNGYSISGGPEATVWNPVSGEVRGLGFAYAIPQSSASGLSSAGIMSGHGGNAAVYTLNGDSKLLPIGNPTQGQVSGARGISADGTLVVGWDITSGGAAFWRANDLAALDYTLFNTSFLQLPENLMLGGVGLMAFSDPILGEIGLFETLDPLTFGSGIGAWNLSDGSLLRYFGNGELADARIYGSELVIAMNGSEGSFLTTLSDPTSLYMSDLFGEELAGLSFAKGGLYEGSLGFVALGTSANGGGSFGVSYQLNPAAVPEPSSLLLFATGSLASAAFMRKRGRKQA